MLERAMAHAGSRRNDTVGRQVGRKTRGRRRASLLSDLNGRTPRTVLEGCSLDAVQQLRLYYAEGKSLLSLGISTVAMRA